MKLSSSIPISLIIFVSLCMLTSNIQCETTIKKLVDKLQDKENAIGDLARLYKSFEALVETDENQTQHMDLQQERAEDIPSGERKIIDLFSEEESVVNADDTYSLQAKKGKNNQKKKKQDGSSFDNVQPSSDPINNGGTDSNGSDQVPIPADDTDYETYPYVTPDDPWGQYKRDDLEVADDTLARVQVWGILTEPLIGTLKDSDNIAVNDFQEYIPAAHVKFLQQIGCKVVPISYKLDKTSLFRLLDQVNGLYIHGDSRGATSNNKFQSTFSFVIEYAFNQNGDDSQYFPIFMMGNSLQSYLYNRVQTDLQIMKAMAIFTNKNVNLRATMDSSDTFLFDSVPSEDFSDLIQDGQFFNKQLYGLTVRDFQEETRINKRMNIIATIQATQPITNKPQVVDINEYVAIAELLHFPIYFITVNIETTQFVFNDPTAQSPVVLDHSIASRSLAQLIAQQLSIEGRKCTHTWTNQDTLFSNLIRHQELANVEYSSFNGLSSLPNGLTVQEIYLITSPSE